MKSVIIGLIYLKLEAEILVTVDLHHEPSLQQLTSVDSLPIA